MKQKKKKKHNNKGLKKVLLYGSNAKAVPDRISVQIKKKKGSTRFYGD